MIQKRYIFIPPKRIRAKAICIIKNENRIFVAVGFDSVKNEYFYVPLGGEIEYLEKGNNTIEREFIEEINQKIINIKYLATIENIFEYEGHQGHEIILVYTGDFFDETIYQIDELYGIEGETKFKAIWKNIDDFKNPDIKLVPKELLELIF